MAYATPNNPVPNMINVPGSAPTVMATNRRASTKLLRSTDERRGRLEQLVYQVAP